MKFKQSVYLFLAVCFTSISINCMNPDDLKKLINKDQVINAITKVFLLDGELNRKDVLKSLNVNEIARKLNAEPGLVREALEIMLENPSLKLKAKQYIQSLAPAEINKLRGFVIGAGGLTLLWLLGHACCHNIMEAMEPQSFIPSAAFAGLATFLTYKAYKVLNLPKPVSQVVMAQAVPMALAAADHLLSDDGEEEKKDAK